MNITSRLVHPGALVVRGLVCQAIIFQFHKNQQAIFRWKEESPVCHQEDQDRLAFLVKSLEICRFVQLVIAALFLAERHTSVHGEQLFLRHW